MGFFDRLAVHAISTGRNAAEFRNAAQGNAKGTWGWLILGAIVWYFAGPGWAAIPFVLAAYSAYKSVSAILIATKLESLYKNSDSD